jgi:hypothetical protein
LRVAIAIAAGGAPSRQASAKMLDMWKGLIWECFIHCVDADGDLGNGRTLELGQKKSDRKERQEAALIPAIARCPGVHMRACPSTSNASRRSPHVTCAHAFLSLRRAAHHSHAKCARNRSGYHLASSGHVACQWRRTRTLKGWILTVIQGSRNTWKRQRGRISGRFCVYSTMLEN